jgi:DNA polymerase III gamma/tau subunit
MPLQHSYRPADFEGFIGNEEVIASLKAVLERTKDIPHCFLFTGPSGIGKTTLARIIKFKLGVSDSDYIELDASSDRGIGDMRELKERSKYYPMNGTKSLTLLDECHGITPVGIEAILKLLEEPPEHAYFVLCTTEANAFKPTLKRRLHCYDLKPVPERMLQRYLEFVYKQEGIEITDDDKDTIQKICENSDGSPGKALKLLDQVIDLTDHNQIVALIEGDSSFIESNVAEICQGILKNQPWDELGKKVKSLTGDFEEYRRNIMAYLGACLVNSGDKRIADIMMNFSEPITVHSGKAGLILLVYYASKS